MIRRFALLLCAAAALALAACSSGGGKPSSSGSELNDNTGGGTYQGLGLTTPQPRPSFTLTDTAHKPFAFGKETAGRPTLLYFGYTNCPDVCPTTMADIKQALAAVPASAARKTFVVFVTTDVKRDSPAVVKRWLQNFSGGTQGATFVGLTGSQAQVDAAQAAAHVTLAQDGGQTHAAETLLYGTDDYARVEFPQSTQLSKQVTHDLSLVAKG